MARMHSRVKGKARSHRPPLKMVQRWLKTKKEEIENLVVKLAKENYSSAMIGLILRDQYGIPSVKAVTGMSITQILKKHNLYPQYPEDLLNLFRRLVNLDSHLKAHKMDKHSKRSFINLESKVRRLIKYYKSRKILPKDFEYNIDKIRLIVEK